MCDLGFRPEQLSEQSFNLLIRGHSGKSYSEGHPEFSVDTFNLRCRLAFQVAVLSKQ